MHLVKSLRMVLAVLALLALTAHATDSDWHVLSSGGTEGTAPNLRLAGTIGQTAVGTGSATDLDLSHGFWQPFEGPGCCVIRGDIDHNGAGPDIADLVYLVEYMFPDPADPGPPPPCEEPPGSGYCAEADVGGNGTGPDIADLVYLTSYMFPDPSDPGPPPVPCP
jgi:hypothetical protein